MFSLRHNLVRDCPVQEYDAGNAGRIQHRQIDSSDAPSPFVGVEPYNVVGTILSFHRHDESPFVRLTWPYAIFSQVRYIPLDRSSFVIGRFTVDHSSTTGPISRVTSQGYRLRITRPWYELVLSGLLGLVLASTYSYPQYSSWMS